MTDAERLDLQRATVARIRSWEVDKGQTVEARGRIIAGARRGGIAAQARLALRSRVAARYASLCRVTLDEASRALDIPKSSVRSAWESMYSGVQAPLNRRRA